MPSPRLASELFPTPLSYTSVDPAWSILKRLQTSLQANSRSSSLYPPPSPPVSLLFPPPNSPAMRPATIAKWLQENANAPPPPATPAGLPDDTVSTVYPESSVSNPYASRYTGTRHRSLPIARTPQAPYVERRPSSAQAHHRDHHQPIIVTSSSSRNRHNSFSDSRYMPVQPQPFTYAYTQPQTNYFAPASVHHVKHGNRNRGGQYSQSAPQYRVTSSPSPTRGDSQRPYDSRPHVSYAAYHSTPTIALQTRSSPTKKAPLLRRIFGNIEWGSTPAKSSPTKPAPPRESSRSPSKSKSKSHSRSSDRDSNGYRPSRNRSHSDGIVYIRY